MPTKYIIKAESTETGERKGTLTRHTREAAFEAADTLLDAFGENTSATIEWEMCGSLEREPSGIFE